MMNAAPRGPDLARASRSGSLWGLIAFSVAIALATWPSGAWSARVVAVSDQGQRTVSPGNPVAIALFLELGPGESVTRVRLEIGITNLEELTYTQVPDLVFGAIPHAPWFEVSFIDDAKDSLPGGGDITAMHLSLAKPVTADVVSALHEIGMAGGPGQVPLGGIHGVATGTGEIAIRFKNSARKNRCEGVAGACRLELPSDRILTTGVKVGGAKTTRVARAGSSQPSVSAGPSTKRPKAKPKQTAQLRKATAPRKKKAPARTPPVSAGPGQCRVDLEQAQVDLAKAQVEVKQTQLDLAQMKLGLEQTQLELARGRQSREKTQEDLAQLKRDLEETRGELRKSEAAREKARAELTPAAERIEDLEEKVGGLLARLADADGDGVFDAADLCSDTTRGASADASGCSLNQFCRVQDVRSDLGRASCWNADFLNDEPLGNPQDCKVDGSTCLASKPSEKRTGLRLPFFSDRP